MFAVPPSTRRPQNRPRRAGRRTSRSERAAPARDAPPPRLSAVRARGCRVEVEDHANRDHDPAPGELETRLDRGRPRRLAQTLGSRSRTGNNSRASPGRMEPVGVYESREKKSLRAAWRHRRRPHGLPAVILVVGLQSVLADPPGVDSDQAGVVGIRREAHELPSCSARDVPRQVLPRLVERRTTIAFVDPRRRRSRQRERHSD